MFNITCKFFQLNHFIKPMSKPSNKPPINLLNRLKIVHSYSAQSIKNTKSASQKPGLSSQSAESVDNNISQNIFAKIPHQTSLNRNGTLAKDNTTISPNKIIRPKISLSKNTRSSLTMLNKDASRPFSTFGRFLSTPSGSENQNFIIEICQGILTSKIKNIVVMAGAGISCPSGIPDFRSPGTGLYDNLKTYNIPYPEAIFDIEYFLENPKPFFALAKELFPSGKYRPNKVHYFFRLLQDKKILRRIYTQNIDGLERLAGVRDFNLVEAHGTFASASCTACREQYPAQHIKKTIDKSEICYCSKCGGLVKPDIVFFGEDLPQQFHLYKTDFYQADLLFVMGTSLEVEPFASIVDSTRFNVPRILINKQAVGVFRAKRRVHDNCILGDIIDGIDAIVKTLGWETELDKIMKDGEEQKIDFINTISKITASVSTRNYSTSTNTRRTRPWLFPPLQRGSMSKSKFSHTESESSSESLQNDSSSSSFDSDTS